MEQLLSPVIAVESESFHDAWAMAVSNDINRGVNIEFGGLNEKKKVERKTAIDSRQIIVLTGEAIGQIIHGETHPQYPFKRIAEYCKEFTYDNLREYTRLPEKKKFTYLYFERLVRYPRFFPKGLRKLARLSLKRFFRGYQAVFEELTIDQLEALRDCLAEQIKYSIFSNRCQAITWEPEQDLKSSSPPCLQRIQIRYLGNGRVDVDFNWRSRDLFTAWQSNLVCLVYMLVKYVLEPNNCTIVRITDSNFSLHVYRGDLTGAVEVEPLAVLVEKRMVIVNPQMSTFAHGIHTSLGMYLIPPKNRIL